MKSPLSAILWGEALGAVAVVLMAPLFLRAPASSPELAREEVPLPPVLDPDRLAALCIFAEARGESFAGQVAVGNVIRNRMARRYQSDGTVPGTVFRPFQFSWANTDDGQRVRVLSAHDEDMEYVTALRAWHASATERPVGDAVLYHAEYVSPKWAVAEGVRLVRQIGRHLFYDETRG